MRRGVELPSPAMQLLCTKERRKEKRPSRRALINYRFQLHTGLLELRWETDGVCLNSTAWGVERAGREMQILCKTEEMPGSYSWTRKQESLGLNSVLEEEGELWCSLPIAHMVSFWAPKSREQRVVSYYQGVPCHYSIFCMLLGMVGKAVIEDEYSLWSS